MKRIAFALTLLSAMFISCTQGDDVVLTRGIGVYPGDVQDYTGPIAYVDNTYRNVALHKAVYASSSYDYNLTGHLATDGIIHSHEPYIIDVSTHNGSFEKRDRERFFDDNATAMTFPGGEGAFLQIYAKDGIPEADLIEFEGTMLCNEDTPDGYEIILEGSKDGVSWEFAESILGDGLPGEPRMSSFQTAGSQNVAVNAGLGKAPKDPFEGMTPAQVARIKRLMNTRILKLEFHLFEKYQCLPYYRLKLANPEAEEFTFSEINFHRGGEEISILPTHRFTSCYMSEGCEEEWLYVDLGAKAKFDKVILHWQNKAVKGSVQTSDDAKHWKTIASLPGGEAAMDEINVHGSGRYVRILMQESIDGGRYILDEMEIMGTGGLSYKPQAQQDALNGELNLRGGNWKLQRVSEVAADGDEISSAGFNDADWIPATVPGTVATSYYNIGAIPDIRYSDDQLQISESFFLSDFWYRNTFVAPAEGKRHELVFDGIDWKADVYFNGQNVGRIEGAYIRSRIDVTDIVRPGEENVIAVRIHCNDNPGIVKEQTRITADTNGGELGGDNPTFHASIGWDWIPTVRGRNIGIWNDVKFVSSVHPSVSLDDVFVTTDLPLPSTSYADIKAHVQLTNHSASADEAGSVNIKYGPLQWGEKFTIPAAQTIEFDLATARLDNPSLWWPVGYGEPYLYDVEVECIVNDEVIDSRKFKSGVREMSYTTDGGVLDLCINGRRLICNGGNWGFPEINLNYRAREYDIAVAYHADMNFTMIRNWVGMTGDEEFFEACDRHGVMIWQDFWLANAYDGPNPYDEAMFEKNAVDFVKKIRNHPSIAIYVGRNEGNPPATLNDALVNIVNTYHPGIYYIPHSADGMVSGNGPYRALPVEEYFAAERGKDRIHSERGMPNVMTAESIKTMLDEKDWWPQTSIWGIHDYTLENAQSCATFNDMIATAFREPSSLDEFASWAQWINYNGYRAMYESRSWNRKGLLIWMSHSCWPSMVWQTYDYYFEPTAAYFGAKKGSAPIRIQWNPVSHNVEVVNNNAGAQNGLTATVQMLNYDGAEMFYQKVVLDSPEDTTTPIVPLSSDIEGLSDTYFIKLTLKRGEELIADNFYWESRDGSGSYKELLSLPKAKLNVRKDMTLENGVWTMNVNISNNSSVPALMIRLKAVGSKSGERILPAFYEDNYFALLPGESKAIQIHFKQEDSHGEKPSLEVSGFNVLK